MPKPTQAQVRACFPSLAGPTVYLENAGGSQVPASVADAVHRYMTETYVQLGAPYDVSRRATAVVEQAHEFVNRFMNGTDLGMAVLGPSTTQLLYMLAECWSRRLEPGDEVVICEAAHEANAGPWQRLERFGVKVRTWKIDPLTLQCPLSGLEELLGPRTRLVTFPHVSNLLGEIVDVAAITRLAHSAGARVVVDGVAYAPHRAIDVKAWGVDFYAYSTYKVFGPHMGALFGTHGAFAELEGPNHFFLPASDPYKFELGGPCHEGCAGLLGLEEFLCFAAGSKQCDRAAIEAAWAQLAEWEQPPTEKLLAWLQSRPDITIWGPKEAGANRVGTISFTSSEVSPEALCARTDKANIAIRYGHMYAYRLCKALGIPTESGVVRASFLGLTTPEEVDRLIGCLEMNK